MENPTGIIPNPPPQALLEKIRAIVSENCDDYLLVISIGNNIHTLYKTKTNAFGMASLICHDINQEWWITKNTKP